LIIFIFFFLFFYYDDNLWFVYCIWVKWTKIDWIIVIALCVCLMVFFFILILIIFHLCQLLKKKFYHYTPVNKKGNNLKTSLELVRLDMFQNKGIEVLDRLLISAFNQKLHIWLGSQIFHIIRSIKVVVKLTIYFSFVSWPELDINSQILTIVWHSKSRPTRTHTYTHIYTYTKKTFKIIH